MLKFDAGNERIKREYLTFLREAKGQDESSLDKVAQALREFEDAVGGKSFKAFHREWATTFKRHLGRRKSKATGKPLSLTTRDATLRLVRAFIEWLSAQPGYKSRISYSDAAYFNNNAREARAAHMSAPMRYPSLEQCRFAFAQMPTASEIERRDRAIFACLMMTGARDGALSSLRLKHVDLVEGKIFQDGREMRTKNGKSFETWFFPVDREYRTCFVEWVRHLREERLYGPSDAVFPKIVVGVSDGRFSAQGLSREPYAGGQAINKVVQAAFERASIEPFPAHRIRKTLVRLMDKTCQTMEQRKAWSQNLGHEHLATTVSAYMPVGPERQGELIRAFAE